MRKSALRVLRAALASVLIMAMIAPTALALSAPVWINAYTRVYEYPTTGARSVAVGRGLSVTLTAYKSGWGRLSYKGRTGYIPLKYITLKQPIRGYLSTSAAIYRGPGTGKLGVAPAGTMVYVIGVDGSYARILSQTVRASGYVEGRVLTRTAPAAPSAPATGYGRVPSLDSIPNHLRSNTTSPAQSRIEYTIYVAQYFIGAPYAESAEPPKTFDCSKLCYYCYGKSKSNVLKGSSYSQGYDDSFPRIDAIADLKRGDMVCFDTIQDDDLSDHVGIYLGDGYFLHASSEAKKVIVSTLASGYYNRVFSWGRRIFDS